MSQVPLPTRLCRQVDYKVSPPQQCGEPATYDGFCRQHRLRHLVEEEIARDKVSRLVKSVKEFLDCSPEDTRVRYEDLQATYQELMEHTK